jgi:MacB-like periplasmic core domain/FtsX-like permease family
MGAVGTKVGAELRTRWRSSVALAAVVAVALAVVLAAAAGARRTETAYPRFLQEGNAADVLVSAVQSGIAGGLYRRIGALPEVQRIAVAAGIPMSIILPSGRRFGTFGDIASVDGRLLRSIERPNLVAGRLPNPRSRGEILINRFAAARLSLAVGDRVQAVVFPFSPENTATLPVSEGHRITLRVVGIGVNSTDVVPANQLDRYPSFISTPALYHSFRFRQLNFDGAFVRLRPGADLARFRSEVRRMAAADPRAGGAYFANEADQHERVRRAIVPQAAALGLFALLAALASLLAVSQMASRQVWVDGLENPTLRALGMTRRQLVAAALARVAVVAAAGATAGAVFAAAASPLFPLGAARLAETHPGFAVNWAILGGGLVATVVVLVAVTALPAWRVAGAAGSAQGLADHSVPASWVGAAAVRAGLPVSAATGVRMAVEPGRGRTAVPVRSALAGLALGIAAVVAASTFGTNLDRLVHDPVRFGWNWDAMVDLSFSAAPPGDIRHVAAQVPAVAAYSGGVYSDLTIAGTRIPTIGIDPLRGAIYPTLLRGRNATRPGEIVLGATTAGDVDAGVGAVVTVQLPTGANRRMRVVGEAVFPTFGQGSFTPTSLGTGAEVPAAVLPVPDVIGANGRRVHPQPAHAYNFVLVRFRPGTDVVAATDRLRRVLYRTGCPAGQCDQLGPVPPADISSYRRVVATPIVLSGLLGLLAAVLMVHVLVTSVRRRRRDLAVLKTLGFSKRQVGATVAWQATTLAAFSLLVGVPLGIATGRWAWSFFADRLGVGPNPTVPILVVLLAVPATLLLANAIAALPARGAARTRPAALLRTE